MTTKKITWRDWLPDWKSLGKIVFYIALLYVLQVFVILPLMTYVLNWTLRGLNWRDANVTE